MNVLLDECLPRRLTRELRGHSVRTVPRMGWSGIDNGRLLHLAATQFDVFVTVDRNLRFQQNLARVPLAVVVLRSRSNRFEDLRPLVPDLLAALQHALERQVRIIGA